MGGIHIVIIAAAILLSACHRTAPQSPSRRSSDGTKADTTVLSLMELNQRMAAHADRELFRIVDSVRQADHVDFAQMSCGGWKMRRDSVTREKSLYADSPRPNENWRVHIQSFDLQGHMLMDTEKVYTIKHFDMPIAVEEAVEDMFAGEKTVVYAPWYTAYGLHGEHNAPPYTNIRFVVTLKEKE